MSWLHDAASEVAMVMHTLTTRVYPVLHCRLGAGAGGGDGNGVITQLTMEVLAALMWGPHLVVIARPPTPQS